MSGRGRECLARDAPLICQSVCSVHKQMFDFLDGLLRHKADMVNIEAARAICDMKGVTPQELYRPVASEHEFWK